MHKRLKDLWIRNFSCNRKLGIRLTDNYFFHFILTREEIFDIYFSFFSLENIDDAFFL